MRLHAGVRGVIVAAMPFTLKRQFQIEAAHQLTLLPDDHKCRRLHGHSFHIDILVTGEADPTLGWVMDYERIDEAWAPLFKTLDHHFLNEIPGLENPTSETFARWIFDRLRDDLPGLSGVQISETCQETCLYTPG